MNGSQLSAALPDGGLGGIEEHTPNVAMKTPMTAGAAYTSSYFSTIIKMKL
jgi:hypothetical protein